MKSTTNRYVALDSTGKFVINPVLKDVLPAWLTLPAIESTLPFALPAASPVVQSAVRFRQNNYNAGAPTCFIGKHLIFADSSDGTSAAAFTAQLFDDAGNRSLMCQPLHIRALFGTAQLPGVLHEPLIIPANSDLRMILAKLTGGAANIRPYIAGRLYYNPSPSFLAALVERKRYVAPYWLTPDNNTVSLSASATTSYRVKVGLGNFHAMTLVAISTGSFNVEITEITTRRTIMNGAISQTNGIGTALYPMRLPAPYTIPHGAVVRFTFTDTSVATNRIFCALQGKALMCPLREISTIERETAIPYDTIKEGAL